ncbi:MAG: hypothetical protein U5S82_23335 [Gammaproteobacteria bacterium]|nr:hypothetical protein [Gammaproteobacteria bacterium]
MTASDDKEKIFCDMEASLTGDLAPEDQVRLLEILSRDPELAREYCAQRYAREALKLVYGTPPSPPFDHHNGKHGQQKARSRGALFSLATAAGLTLLVAGGFMGAWLESARTGFSPASFETAMDEAQPRLMNTVLNISTDDEAEVHELLLRVDDLMGRSTEAGVPVKVEIVFHGSGLNLVRKDHPDQARPLLAMMRNHPNLKLYACNRTRARMERNQGSIELISPVQVVSPGALEFVMKRVQAGWQHFST